MLTYLSRNYVGTVKSIKAALHIKENVKPVFCKARQVPFALRPAVERELARMQSEGIIAPVDFNEWATPLHLKTSWNSTSLSGL